MTNPRETVFYHFLAGLPESQAGPPSKDQVFNVLTSHLFPSPDFARAAMSSANEETEGPTGQRVCGHVFVSGDVVYRCRNCGLDETCVMCATCFKATEHDGHDISISVTAGSGGCCDCGDAEAWKVPLKCKLHSPPVETSVRQEPLPENFILCMRDAVAAAMDFVLDIIELSPPESKMIPSAEVRARVPAENQKEGLKYVLTLWNDETHSFEEVIDEVMEATGCSRDEAQEIAVNVDSEGRQSIETSVELQRLVEIGDTIELSRLALTIVDERQAFNETVAALVIKWLKFLSTSFLSPIELNGKLYEPMNASLRRIIAELLFAPRRHVRRVALSLPLPVIDAFEEHVFSSISKEPHPEVSHAMITESRLHYFLHFDVRLWKMPRTDLKEVFISSIISFNETYKRQLGIIFGYHYITLARIYILQDREFDRSILNLSVQLFTVPSIAQTLASCTNLLPAMFVLLKAIFLTDALPSDYRILTNFNDAYLKAQTDFRAIFPPMTCTTDIAHNKRLWHFFQDVKYLVAPELIQKGLFRSSETNLQCFLDLLRVWEGKHVQERSASRHVEYESEAWIHAFNTGLYSFRLLKHVGDCFLPSDNLELDLSQLVESLKTTVRALSIWCVADLGRYLILPQKTTSDGFFYTVDEGSKHYHLPDFVVSQRPVSMHFELHWFFAEVIAKVPRLLSQVNNPSIAAQFWRMLFTEDSVMTPVDQAADLASHTDLLKKLDIQKRVTLIFDYPLRSIVFVSQIKADLWVRNGASMRTQALHFRDVTLRECYDDNLFLLQTASAVMDPDLLLMLFIERFELATWLDWSKSQNTLNLDADHMPRVAETLLEVLIYILAERARALGASNEIEARREVIHHLGSSKGITYSSLVRLLPEEVSDLSFTSDGQTKIFDDVLNSVANFKSPDGLQDKGLYELKEELYSELDPWFWHLSRSERTSLESILKEKAKTSEGLVRVPNIDPLPLHSPYRPIVRLINEPLFMRIVFYSIWRATKTREESGQPSVSNDTLLSAGVQLLMIGIAQSSISADSTQSFFSNMSRIQHWVPKDAGLETEQKTMVDLLCTLLDRGSETDIKDHISRVQYILKILEESDDPLAKSIIAKHNKSQQKGLDAMALDSAQESDNEKQKRKLAAKARKAAIMAQMAQAQQSFMDNQEEDWDEELEDAEPQSEDVFHTPSEKRPDERTVQFPTGSCIFCQEDASTHDLRVYGVLGLIQMSDLERFCKVDDTKPELSSFLQDFSWDKEIPRLSGSTPDLSSVNQAIHQSGLHASSCGHIMHMTCFEGYCTSIRVRQMGQPTRNHPEDSSKVEFLCPLCRTLGNALFPIGAPDYPQFVNWSGVEGMHERDTAVTEFPESGLEALENWFSQTAKRKIKKLVFFEGSTDVDEQPASQSISAGLQSFISNLWMLRATTSPSEFRKFDTQQAFEDHVLPIFNVFGGAWHDEVEEADIRARDFEGLWGIVAFTLEALEIQLRGTGQSASAGRFPRVGILDRLTPQLSSFLPVLSSSIITYQEALLANQENREAVIYRLQNLTHPLFFDEDDFCDLHPSDLTPFCLLVRLCGLVHTTLKGSVNDFLMWTRLCWFLCITRSLSSLLVSSKVPTDTMETTYSPALQQLFQCLHLPVTGTLTESQIYKFVESQCLIFARRAVLFSYTFCGMVPPTGTLGFAYDEELLGEPAAQEGLKEDSELSRLTRYLNLPSVESVLNSDVTRRPFFQQLARASSLRIVKEGQIVKSDLLVSLPGVYELVRLPDRYDTLFEKSLHFSCPKCSQTPAMPAMCLVCGQIVCSQSYCCAENGVGECNQHVEVCSKEIGIFLQIKQGVIVLLHGKKGHFMNAPYLDAHGEPDHGLKRGKPLFLNQKRYDELRRTWLTHGIPSLIGRKMEQTFDFGGWTTL